ncbi:MAG: phosphoribosylformylglycinamidine synthase subunit PurL [Candidatus Omnitrophota bacterium]
MLYRIQITERPGIFDAVGSGIARDIRDLGIKAVESVHFAQIYNIEGELSVSDAETIARELLVDRLTQNYIINARRNTGEGPDESVVEIAYNPGVMDPVEDSVLKAISDLGIRGVRCVKTAKRYLLKGRLNAQQLKTISEKLLYNKLIQHSVDLSLPEATAPEIAPYRFRLITVELLGADDRELKRISRDGQLFLNLAEMQRIRRYFKDIGRNPTDCELETVAQTWSEHCGHKTFRGDIEYKFKDSPLATRFKTRKIKNLLKSTIMKVTRELAKPWCVSVFEDNSGVIRFDDKYNVCFKVETHNHPSALEPFGGANTGIGGVIRDPLGTGLGARPFLNTDVFCFGPTDYPFSKLPPGVLHPKRVMKGVVSGVRDYGNKMGIPTVNGAVLFHEGFVGNPLVYCGTAGLIPKDKTAKRVRPGDLVVVVGGRTGRDGIHGATFSSGELTHESESVSSGAVQIGNPIQEKKMLDTIMEARDLNLYSAITDCGAGGLSSAVGEMGKDIGARVDLEKVPLKYTGLSYTEIWISESQERMVLAVPRKNAGRLIQIFSREDTEATVIGEFVPTGKLELYYESNKVCELDMEFLHNGFPRLSKKAVYLASRHREPRLQCPSGLTDTLLKLLSRYDVCSKEWIIRQYDHEVQGGSVIKPLAGIDNDGPSDAAVVKPVLWSPRAVVISCGINFRYGFVDPYWMAASCIDEALRQIVATGGSLKQAALLDNFCWGNPDKPDRLGGLVRAALACYDIAKGFGVPFISGKDSLNNEYAVGGKSIAIPGTLLISAMAVMDDAKNAVSMYAKEAGDLIYVVGKTYHELGGSHYYDLLGFTGNSVPKVNTRIARETFLRLSRASGSGVIKAMHDCSEGGLAVAAAEMAFAGGRGMELFLSEVPYSAKGKKSNDTVLFSESNSRFIVEVDRRRQKQFERMLAGVPFGLMGCISEGSDFKVWGLDNKLCVSTDIARLKEAWQAPLRW